MATHILSGDTQTLLLESGISVTISGVAGELQTQPPSAPRAGMRALDDSMFDVLLAHADLTPKQTLHIVPEQARGFEVPVAAPRARQATIEVEHAPGEGVLVLVQDENGALSWRFPEAQSTGRRALAPASVATRSTITVDLAPAPAAPEGARLFGGIVGKILKVFVYPVTDAILSAVGKPIVRSWEASNRPYNIRTYGPDDYKVDAVPSLTGAEWRSLAAGKSLLFVHGTFSSCGAFRGIDVGAMRALAEQYEGRMLAFDHPTMSDDPGDNAEWFLGEMQKAGVTLDVDIVCHSRGGLVSRELAARGAAKGLKVGKIVLVGVPDAGTALADADHMVEMVDRFTTIASVVPEGMVKTILTAAIAGLKVVAHGFLSDLPGLCAMAPASPYLSTLNRTTANGSELFAIASNFDPAPGTPFFSLRRAENAAMDRVFDGSANDLVVPRDGVYDLRHTAGFPVGPDARLVFDAADGVIHTEYFAKPETQRQIVTWLVTPQSQRALAGAAVRELEPGELEKLRPHAVTLANGSFARRGTLPTSREDVDRIFDRDLPEWIASHGGQPLRIAVWAHGGLVNETEGLAIAKKHVDWWKRNGVYPLYFLWETGLFDALGSILAAARRPTRALDERGLTDLSDKVIERICRALHGDRIWGAMKDNAEACSAEDGGARYVARRLAALCRAHPQLEIHTVGHSAGSIFHSHWIPAALQEGLPFVNTLQMLAPAIRADEFMSRLAPLAGTGTRAVAMYSMADSYERADNCMQVYQKSLLYLIYHALERSAETPLVGLAVSVANDPQLRTFFGLDGQAAPASAVWSVTQATTGASASTSTSHGGFDDDPATMNSVGARVLGTDVPLVRYVGSSRRGREWPLLLDMIGADVFAAAAAAAPSPLAPVRPAPVPVASPVSLMPAIGAGRRVALCVGIDAYPAPNTLSGCVNDAKLWAKVLKERLQFEVLPPLLDRTATRQGILGALTNLVRGSKAGDVLVFQYSGHGTQLPDDDGDEADGKDEAMVPVDFAGGQFVIDDDIRGILQELPADVSFTCFIDCCHSATMTRLLGATSALGTGGKARFMKFEPDDPAVVSHLANRANERNSGATRAFRDRTELRAVNFSACQAVEVAYENDGNGDFTRITSALLMEDLARCTNAELQQRIIDRFGSSRRQTPDLDCTAEMAQRILFAPLTGAKAEPAKEVAAAALVGDRRGLVTDRRADPMQRYQYDKRSSVASGRRGTDLPIDGQDAETLRAIARKIDEVALGF